MTSEKKDDVFGHFDEVCKRVFKPHSVVLTDEMAESITGQKSCLDPSMKVSVEDALEALESMDDFARMDISVTPIGPYSVLHKFIDQVVREREEAAAKVARVTTLESRSNVSDH